jgi:Leucine-rich repeat (LRR) protein
LDCSYNNLTNLDVSVNPQLKKLDCSRNELTSLNFQGCSQLKEFKCHDNPVVTAEFVNSIDLDNYPVLQKKNICLIISKETEETSEIETKKVSISIETKEV